MTWLCFARDRNRGAASNQESKREKASASANLALTYLERDSIRVREVVGRARYQEMNSSLDRYIGLLRQLMAVDEAEMVLFGSYVTRAVLSPLSRFNDNVGRVEGGNFQPIQPARRYRDEFSASGSILEVITDPTHPVMAGMPSRANVFFSRSPVFTTEEGFEGVVLAKHLEAGSPLRSGFLLGEDRLHGFAAALDVHHGQGHVILLGFKPQWRGQPFGTFRILFNAALFHGRHGAEATGTDGFWTPPRGRHP